MLLREIFQPPLALTKILMHPLVERRVTDRRSPFAIAGHGQKRLLYESRCDSVSLHHGQSGSEPDGQRERQSEHRSAFELLTRARTVWSRSNRLMMR